MNRMPVGQPSAVAWAAGLLIGGLSGFVLWITTDTFVFLPAFLGLGVSLALIIQAAAEGRSDR